MPLANFGLRKKGLPKSSGLSSNQTFSSFCHSDSRPSIFLASLMTVAKGGGPPAVGACAAADAAPLGADAAAAALGAGLLAAAAWAPGALGSVEQPASRASAAATPLSEKTGVEAEERDRCIEVACKGEATR